VTISDLLASCDAVGVHVEVRGDHLHVEAPAGVVTAALRDALRRHKADLLTLLAPVTAFVTLRGGLVLPVPALALALDLERRGFQMGLDADQQFQIVPAGALTELDQAAIQRWRRHLGAIVAYDAEKHEGVQ